LDVVRVTESDDLALPGFLDWGMIHASFRKPGKPGLERGAPTRDAERDVIQTGTELAEWLV
jgi:hypothetical protein